MTTKVIIMHDTPGYDKGLNVKIMAKTGIATEDITQEEIFVKPNEHVTAWVHSGQYLIVEEE